MKRVPRSHTFLLVVIALAVHNSGFAVSPRDAPRQAQSVADTPSTATAPDGHYISWVEHRIDDEQINGGIPLRGGDGLVMADIDLDGFMDIASVH